MGKFLSKFRTVTHVVAVGVAAGVGWLEYTEAGKSILHQYPQVVPVVGAIMVILGLYHIPIRKPSGN